MDVQKKFKLLSAEVKFLKKELEITEGIIKDALPEFNKQVIDKLKGKASIPPQTDTKLNNCNTGEQNIAQPPRYSESSYEDREEDQKKLFKKIALKTHPDRLSSKSQFEKDFKQNLFDKAHKAIQEDDYFSLAEIAEKLDIETPNPNKKHIDNLEVTRKRLRQEIDKFKKTYIWAWYFEESEDSKEKIIEKYLDHVQGLKK